MPDQMELRQALAAKQAMLLTLMSKRLKQERQRVNALAQTRSLKSPTNYLNDRRMALDYTHRRLCAASAALLNRNRERFVRLAAKLDAMSPLKVLGRGYSMTLNEKGELIKTIHAVSVGEKLTVSLADGKAVTEVREIIE